MSNLKTLSTFFNRNFSLTRIANAIAIEFNAQYILDDIYTHFFNIQTADGAWLDAWGRIVAMPRSVALPSNNYFGFKDTPFTPFNHAPFYGGTPDLSNVTMSDTIYRKAIKAKALANRSGRTIPDINAVLELFMDVDCYAIDGYDMTITLSIDPLWAGSTELAVVMSDVLGLRPAGVKMNVTVRVVPETWILRSPFYIGDTLVSNPMGVSANSDYSNIIAWSDSNLLSGSTDSGITWNPLDDYIGVDDAYVNANIALKAYTSGGASYPYFYIYPAITPAIPVPPVGTYEVIDFIQKNNSDFILTTAVTSGGSALLLLSGGITSEIISPSASGGNRYFVDLSRAVDDSVIAVTAQYIDGVNPIVYELWASTDGGATFTQHGLANRCHVIPDGSGLLITVGSTLYKSTDLGDTRTAISGVTIGGGDTLSCSSTGDVIIVAGEYKMDITTDSGATWTSDSQGNAQSVIVSPDGNSAAMAIYGYGVITHSGLRVAY